jgi:hypothetical protein
MHQPLRTRGFSLQVVVVDLATASGENGTQRLGLGVVYRWSWTLAALARAGPWRGGGLTAATEPHPGRELTFAGEAMKEASYGAEGLENGGRSGGDQNLGRL